MKGVRLRKKGGGGEKGWIAMGGGGSWTHSTVPDNIVVPCIIDPAVECSLSTRQVGV